MTGDTELGLLLHDPFPEPEPTTEQAVTPPRPARRFKRPRTLTTAVVIVAVVAATVGIWAATGSSAATYRWTAVTKADVDQTLDSYGTVTPIHQADVTFPVSGTVATVPVKVGAHVTAGQTLATLDISALQSKLDSAKSTLATAQAKLVADQQAQATGATVAATNTSATLSGADTGQATPLATPSPSGGTSRTGRTSGTSGTGTTASAQAAVTQAQNNLLAAQKAVDSDTSAIATALQTCASLLGSLQNSGGATPSPSPSGFPSTGGSGPAPVADTTACTSLLNGLPSQQQLATDQQTVTTDEQALTTAVNQLTAAATKSGSGSSGGSSGGSSSGGSSSSHSTPGGSSSSASSSGRSSSFGGTVTAAQLVVDQSTVDADTANAFVAAEAVNQANLVSPLAGTVAAVNVTPGSTAGTSSAAVTVIGPGADQVSTTVTDLNLKNVHIGADASVTPDGSNTPIHGVVTAIGLLPVSTTSSSTSSSSSRSGAASSSSSSTSSSATYPVTISLDTGGLYSGSGADVSIVVKKLSNVLAVPTSAVTTLATLHTVLLQSGGKAVRHVVVVGASDATFTQITSGLTAGERVALAQVNLPVPSSGSTNLARLAGGGGGGRGGFARTGATGTGRTGTTGAARTGG